jgi:hypothetical protein
LRFLGAAAGEHCRGKTARSWLLLRRDRKPGLLQCQGEIERWLSSWAMATRIVNGFIAFGPIPERRGAASCRSLRSWPLGRRSGRVPALPDPPPRPFQCTKGHGRETIHGRATFSQNGVTVFPWICEPRQGWVIRAFALRRIATRCRAHVGICTSYYLSARLEKEDRSRLDRGSLRPPICPATFCNKTFATREGSLTEVSRGMDRGDR